ncbi:hypothetical protein FD755_018883, partial [Muntiacus reevesi]
VNIPKTCQTFCKKCGKPSATERQGKASLCAQGKRCYDTRATITKKIVLRFECFEPSCSSRRMLAIERGKRFELGRDEKDGIK